LRNIWEEARTAEYNNFLPVITGKSLKSINQSMVSGLSMMITAEQPIPSFSGSKIISSAVRKRLQHIVAPHVESFNYMIDYGLEEAIADLPPVEFALDDNHFIKLHFQSFEIGSPTKSVSEPIALTPRECRESGTSYVGSFKGTMDVSIEGGKGNNKYSSSFSLSMKLGDLPIMVMSNKCHLKAVNPKRLAIDFKEESNEVGGYFIVNGIERVIRLLQIQRRNYAVAIERSTFRNRGTNYSDKGIAMKCTRKGDLSSATITLHYLNNGIATLRFVLRKQEFLLPVILIAKSLMNISDKELFDRIVGENHENTFLTTRIELLLRDYKQYKLHSMNECLAYLGNLFRSLLGVSSKHDDIAVGIHLIKRCLFIHIDSFGGKLDCLIHMIRKLFSFVEGKCINDNADALMNHDLLLPGHLINIILKEKIEEALSAMKSLILKDYRMNKTKFENELLKNNKYFQKSADRCFGSIGGRIATFLSSGNLVSSSGLDLMQKSGFTIVAERLNLFRFLSHFQSVHRGQFFTTMKTTTVRKLLPESWGFLCPVHTPDGAPCGLLNHMAKDAVVLSYHPAKMLPATSNVPIVHYKGEKGGSNGEGGEVVNYDLLCSKNYLQEVLVALGMEISGLGNYDGQSSSFNNSSGSSGERKKTDDEEIDRYLSVVIDGIFVGYLKTSKASYVVSQLRRMKSLSKYGKNGSSSSSSSTAVDLPFLLEPTTEIAYIPYMSHDNLGPYPGLYLFTAPGRMIRPVLNLSTKEVEWIGPMEQVFMEIACLKDDINSSSSSSSTGQCFCLFYVAFSFALLFCFSQAQLTLNYHQRLCFHRSLLSLLIQIIINLLVTCINVKWENRR
jgi:DNA-directed RNA polymerase I subunit RPA2